MEKYTVQVLNREATLCDDANNSCNAVKPSIVMQSYHEFTHHCVILPHYCKWI